MNALAAASPTGKAGNVDLNTLVAAIQNSVQAQNLIATRLASVTAALTAAFPPAITSSAVFNPPNLASGASETTTVAAAGATLGQIVEVSFSIDLQGISLTAYVSAADIVTVVFSNLTGGALDLGSGTLKVSVK